MKICPLLIEVDIMIDGNTLCAWALEAGFSDAALCDASPFTQQKLSVDAAEPLKERRQLAFDPKADDSRIRSLAVLLWPYKPAPAAQAGRVFVDSYYYASNAAYHAASVLQARLTAAGCFAKANVSYPAKAAAVRAGLGVIGMNDLLITKEHGTRAVIILMATDIEAGAGVTQSNKAVHACLRCARCIQACPSGALTPQGMQHPQRCLRNFMMEGITVPEDLREKMGRNLIGCDICQRVCPMQPQTGHEPEQAEYLLSDFVTDDAEKFARNVSRLALDIGRNTARPQRVRAQAAILAGNSGEPAYLPVLRTWAGMPFEAVSAHAKWAAEKIDSQQKREPSP